MAGFFSLGGRGATGPHSNNNKEEEEERVVEKHHHHHHNNSSLFLFRNNEEVYNNKGGFEIWPQPYHQNQGLSNYYSFGVGPSSRRNNNDNSNNNSNDEDVSFCVSDESTRFGLTVMRSSSGGGGGTASGGVNCQDCGNQAKKDCAHLRCRTCCKSRGFQCQTHVKSTWVPAAKRRERQQQLAALQQQQLRSDTCSKRHRDTHHQQALDSLPCPPPVPTITTTGLELGQFPSEVSSSAVFRCVKVSAIDSPDEQYAYQTAVNIGGHLFKGILYDQGPQGPYTTAIVAEPSSGPAEPHHQHQQQQLSLITAATTTTAGNPFEPSSLYPAPLNAFMAGTQFFPPPRS
ncbi:hypothetical protein PIB30_002079 [Stylosanthes scabra]|uniref:Uncharacterized protein n=1 Tax=Stylosanthes scabra TaxID=79078 RepID=A0ABU6R3E3_9FABA|nr:hypothetical protein [Stylosanthes scabra]